jgi:DNA-directed RNA polymerase subunit RPC12/RpoP
MKCPECSQEMRWVGDQLIEEDSILQMVYDCQKCKIDVIKNVETGC